MLGPYPRENRLLLNGRRLMVVVRWYTLKAVRSIWQVRLAGFTPASLRFRNIEPFMESRLCSGGDSHCMRSDAMGSADCVRVFRSPHRDRIEHDSGRSGCPPYRVVGRARILPCYKPILRFMELYSDFSFPFQRSRRSRDKFHPMGNTPMLYRGRFLRETGNVLRFTIPESSTSHSRRPG